MGKTIDTKALLPCPFCGGPAKIRSERAGEDCVDTWVGCSSCFASADRLEDAYSNPVGAAATWNERRASDRLAALEAENNRLRAQQASLNGTINKLRRENKRLTGHLRVIATTNQGLGVARRYAKQALAEGGGK